MTKLAADDRVELDGARGVVRFVGPIPGRGAGVTWIGVDWDDATRGKHDGSVDGVQYFQSSHSTSGTFVKASKLGDGGRRSLLDAATLRHAATESEASAAALPGTVGGAGGHTHLVGVEALAARQAAMRDATRLALRGLGVCRVEEPTALAGSLPRLRELDLANCLLSDATALLTVLRGFPHLVTLDVSGNRFDVKDGNLAKTMLMEGACAKDALAARSLRVLVLNRCNLPWDCVLALCRCCPFVEELRLHKSSLAELNAREMPDLDLTSRRSLVNVKLIDLHDNGLVWDDILSSFGRLAALETLYLGSNKIDRIRLEHSSVGNNSGAHMSSNSESFQTLTTLGLSDNPLEEWRSISELNRLKQLDSLRARGLNLPRCGSLSETSGPGVLLQDVDRWYRDGITARLGRLRTLDGSTIQPDERLYAEKRYLNTVLCSFAGSRPPPGILEEHPRLYELCFLHDVDLEERDNAYRQTSKPRFGAGGRTLRDDLVRCYLINVGGFDKDSSHTAVLRLPVGISVARLLGIAARAFGMLSAADVSFCQLLEEQQGEPRRSILLTDDTRDLRHYGLEGGDSVYIEVRGQGFRRNFQWSPC